MRSLSVPLIGALLVLARPIPVPGQTLRASIQFEPESSAFIQAAADYDTLWKAEGARMLEVMESVTGLTFEEREIKGRRLRGSELLWLR